MPQPKNSLYFLQNAAGLFYSVVNRVVSTTGTPTPLPTHPDGWQDASIKFTREFKYFGVLRTFSTPLKFVKEAARIIRDRVWNTAAAFEDRLFLVITMLDKTFGGGWIYQPFYRGELDLSQVNDQDFYVECNVLEG